MMTYKETERASCGQSGAVAGGTTSSALCVCGERGPGGWAGGDSLRRTRRAALPATAGTGRWLG